MGRMNHVKFTEAAVDLEAVKGNRTHKVGLYSNSFCVFWTELHDLLSTEQSVGTTSINLCLILFSSICVYIIVVLNLQVEA